MSEKSNTTHGTGDSAFLRFLEGTAYNTGIFMYIGAVKLVSLFNKKAELMTKGHRQIFRTIGNSINPGEHYIWFHAASLGEFEQGRPLMERIRSRHPHIKIILTFFSPSGYEVRKNFAGADVVCYLPYDTPLNVSKFLQTVKPEMAVFIKYEFWRNYLSALCKRGIPTYLVSAVFRPEQLFFKKRGKWYRDWLSKFNKIFVQDERSLNLLKGIGYNNVTVAGDTRFDRVIEIKNCKKEIPILEEFRKGAESVMMAGSSWEKDEDIYIPWINSHPETKIVIAPHEFDTTRLNHLLGRFNNGAVLMSEVEKDKSLLKGKQALIIDCFGLLSSAYAYCDMAYIGGAFGAGLHNINEAAVYGVPVIFGPKFDKFIEAKELTSEGGAISINSMEEFARVATMLTENSEERLERGKIAGDYIRRKAGASEIILKELCNSF